LEVWQVKAGTIFDNILVTDSVEEAATARAAVVGRKDTESKLQSEESKAEESKTDDSSDAKEDEKADL